MILKAGIDLYKYSNFLPRILITLTSLLIFFLVANNIIINLNSEIVSIIINSISDAYLQVSVFVAAVLLVFYGVENIFGIDLTKKLQKGGIYQVPACSALGALPGCGGALLVITQFTTGNLSFGSVVAVLTSTMGDAAFLLIASEPNTGFFIMFLGFFVGLIAGWLVDFTHPKGFLIPAKIDNNINHYNPIKTSASAKLLWILLLIPGLIIGIFMAFQVDVNNFLKNNYLDNAATLVGFIGGMLLISLHIIASKGLIYKKTSLNGGTSFERTILDTNFVTIWVVLAFLAFEIIIFYTAFDLKQLFVHFSVLTPLIAVLVGFIPGCGPQIIVTSIYLMGIIPLSAQIGNALSNDGDALFPVLAIAPKVGLIATLYSAVPALVISYGYLFIFEL